MGHYYRSIDARKVSDFHIANASIMSFRPERPAMQGGRGDRQVCERPGRDHDPLDRFLPYREAPTKLPAKSLSIAVLKAGMSSGWRLVTQLPSSTTSRLTQFPPAFLTSSWMV